jgi:hypothetical protein
MDAGLRSVRDNTAQVPLTGIHERAIAHHMDGAATQIPGS